MTKVCLIELNEVCFDAVESYIKQGHKLENFSRLIERGLIRTRSEDRYELLEPWIQWVSVHTGKTYEEHKIFRLGDIEKANLIQIFEKIENRGYSVGSISAMNSKNNLKNPSFFIPDPWTKTDSDSSFASKLLAKGISEAVNTNSSKSSNKLALIKIIIGAAFVIHPKQYFKLIKKLSWALKASWRKPIFLDILIIEIFKSHLRRKKPDFGCVFLNAAAHIQHHYYLSSQIIENGDYKNPQWYIDSMADPMLEVYKEYDRFLGFLIKDKTYKYITATGLSQKPVQKPVFYYRLSNHNNFLNKCGIKYTSVDPRMTRDFLIRFDSNYNRDYALKILSSYTLNSIEFFGEIEKRNKELFVTLTYPYEITKKSELLSVHKNSPNFEILNYVNFVAIKNAEHSDVGYLSTHPNINSRFLNNDMHVSKLFDVLCDIFPHKDQVK